MEEIKVANAFRLGKKGEYRPLKITLERSQDKGVIYKNVKNLKGVKNADKKSYRIEDDLPAALQEEKALRRQIYGKNERKKDTASKLIMSFEKGVLKVDNKEFDSPVKHPNVMEMIQTNKQPRFPITKGSAGPGQDIYFPRLFNSSENSGRC